MRVYTPKLIKGVPKTADQCDLAKRKSSLTSGDVQDGWRLGRLRSKRGRKMPRLGLGMGNLERRARVGGADQNSQGSAQTAGVQLWRTSTRRD